MNKEKTINYIKGKGILLLMLLFSTNAWTQEQTQILTRLSPATDDGLVAYHKPSVNLNYRTTGFGTSKLSPSRAIPAQYHITYKYEYYAFSPSTGEKLELFDAGEAAYQEYYITDGKYKSIFDGGNTFMWIYDSQKGERIAIDMDSEITSSKVDEEKNLPLEVVHLDTIVTISGYQCKALKLVYEKSVTTYFYSEKIKVDPESYKNHVSGNWYTVLKEMKGSIPLQFFVEYEQFGYRATPIFIEEVTFDNDEFVAKPSLKSYKKEHAAHFEKLIERLSSMYNTRQFKINTVQADGNVLQGAMSVPLNLKLKNPSSMLMSLSIGGVNFLMGSNDNYSWQYNAIEDKAEVNKNEGKEEREQDHIGSFSPILKKNWDKYEVISIREREDDYRMALRRNQGLEFYCISKSDYLIRKWGNQETFYEVDDYSFYSNVPFPNQITQYNSSNEPVFSATFNDAKFNINIDDSEFEIPENLKAKIVEVPKSKSHEEYYREAELLLENQEYDKAVEAYNQAIKLYPDRLYYNQLGVAMLRKGDYYNAIAAFTDAVRIDTKYATSWYNLGYTKMQMEDYNAAVIDMSKAIEYDNKSPVYYSSRGLSYCNLGQYDSALVDFHQVLKLDEDYDVGYWNLAMAQYNLKMYDDALGNFSTSIENNHNVYDSHSYRGICYYNTERYEEALEEFKIAVKADEPLVNYYANLGSTYSELGMSKKAIAAYKKELELDSISHSTYNAIGLEYFNENSYDAAITAFSQAIDINSMEAVYFDNRATAKGHKMDFVGAIEDYSSSINLYPSDSNIYYLRGEAKISINDKFDACKDFKKATEMGSEDAKESLAKYCVSNN